MGHRLVSGMREVWNPLRHLANVNSSAWVGAGVQWVLPVIAIACAASLCAFAAMGQDKRRARGGMRRTSERALASWALLGGWPGLVAGGVVFRHKTRARGFQAKAVGCALVHAALVAALWWFVS